VWQLPAVKLNAGWVVLKIRDCDKQSAATGGYCQSGNLLPFLESLPKHFLPGIQIDNESRVVKVLVSLGLADGKPIPFSGEGNTAFYDGVTTDKE